MFSLFWIHKNYIVFMDPSYMSVLWNDCTKTSAKKDKWRVGNINGRSLPCATAYKPWNWFIGDILKIKTCKSLLKINKFCWIHSIKIHFIDEVVPDIDILMMHFYIHFSTLFGSKGTPLSFGIELFVAWTYKKLGLLMVPMYADSLFVHCKTS